MELDVIVFAAHPDDAELAMGGTIAKLTNSGIKVGVIDLTRGEMSTRGNVQLRNNETDAATEKLKLTFRDNLDIPDGKIELNDENLKRAIYVIRKIKPKIIFAPYFNDRHPDHIDANRLIKRAVFTAGLEKFETAEDIKLQQPFRPRKLFYYMQTYNFAPSFIVDITDSFVDKMESIKSYKSQFHNPDSNEPATFISSPEFLDYIEARAKFYGFQIGKKYGEPFYCEEEIELDLNSLLK